MGSGSPPIFRKVDNVKKLAIISFLSNLYFYNHIGTLYQQTRGLNLLQVNSIWSIILITIAIAEVPTGVLADKIGRKWSVSIALLLQAIGEFWYFFASSYLSFVLIAILAGIGFAFLSGANEALLYDSLKGKNKAKKMIKASGIVGSFRHLAFFLAPILGGLIVSQLTLSKFLLSILLTAISVSFSFIFSLTLKEPKKAYHHQEQSPIEILKDGFVQLKNSQLRKFLLFGIVASTYGATLTNLFQPYFVSNNLSAQAIAISLSISGLLVVYIQKNAFQLEEKFGLRKALLIANITPGVLYLAMAMSKQYVLIPVFILANASMNTRDPLLSSGQNSLITSKNRATTLSLMNMLNTGYLSLIGLVWGKIATYSVSFTFLIIGAAILISTVLLLPRKLKDEGSNVVH